MYNKGSTNNKRKDNVRLSVQHLFCWKRLSILTDYARYYAKIWFYTQETNCKKTRFLAAMYMCSDRKMSIVLHFYEKVSVKRILRRHYLQLS